MTLQINLYVARTCTRSYPSSKNALQLRADIPSSFIVRRFYCFSNWKAKLQTDQCVCFRANKAPKWGLRSLDTKKRNIISKMYIVLMIFSIFQKISWPVWNVVLVPCKKTWLKCIDKSIIKHLLEKVQLTAITFQWYRFKVSDFSLQRIIMGTFSPKV